MRAGSLFIPVRDLEKSAIWYEKHLGVKRIDSWGEGMGFYFPNGPTQLALIVVEETPTTEFSITHARKNVYYNFLTSDIEQLHKEFQNQKIHVSAIKNFGGMLCFDAVDPDGNVLSFVDEPEDSLYYSKQIEKRQNH
ncbi:VOC family protein [Chryseomicrobium palamuruense]|uniref:VOC family protein n=1 Tax=Chryseomicrobium palamuruense TaxID=682973 RepID=A0ABV8URH9_9BACL